ncbi:MAG: hypothetical protein ACR2JB_00535 [Bryobacteraceae bacterium]
MFADPSFFHKLSDKGVEIWSSAIASTISGIVLATIAGITYFVKLKVDLWYKAKEQRQAIEIKEKEAQRRKLLRQQETTTALNRNRRDQARAMAEVQSSERLQELWDGYVSWLGAQGLSLLPQNAKAQEKYAKYRDKLRDLTEANVPVMAKELSETIAATELPHEADKWALL